MRDLRFIIKDTLLICLPAILVFILKAAYYKTVFIGAFAFKPVFSVLLIAPVCEEIIFRGLLLEYMLKYRILKHPIIPNILTSLLFASLHYLTRTSALSLLVFFPSLVLGWHYTRHRKLSPVILTHFIYNLAAF